MHELLVLDPGDNIGVATRPLPQGHVVSLGGQNIVLARATPTGHKVAVRAIAPGERVVKYGVPIGSATTTILPGDYVHTHNLKSDYIPTWTLDQGHRFIDGAST